MATEAAAVRAVLPAVLPAASPTRPSCPTVSHVSFALATRPALGKGCTAGCTGPPPSLLIPTCHPPAPPLRQVWRGNGGGPGVRRHWHARGSGAAGAPNQVSRRGGWVAACLGGWGWGAAGASAPVRVHWKIGGACLLFFAEVWSRHLAGSSRSQRCAASHAAWFTLPSLPPSLSPLDPGYSSLTLASGAGLELILCDCGRHRSDGTTGPAESNPTPLPPSLTLYSCRDSTDFVQQGALIAMALVLVGQPEARAKPLRDHINRLYGNKGAEVRWKVVKVAPAQPSLARTRRMGALMAAGIWTQPTNQPLMPSQDPNTNPLSPQRRS